MPSLTANQLMVLAQVADRGPLQADRLHPATLASLVKHECVYPSEGLVSITKLGTRVLSRKKRQENAAAVKPGKRAPTNAPVYSSLSTIRRAPHYAVRKTIFLDIDEGTPVRDVILYAIQVDAQRVMLTGGAAFHDWWYLHTLPEQWRHGNHFLIDNHAATGRYYRPTPGDPGRRIEVEVCRARPWFGDAPAAVCARAWGWLAEWIQQQSPSAQLLSTPVTTGRDLWRRQLPKDTAYPILSDEVRALIHATTPQHRRELLPVPAGAGGLAGFAYLDMRLAFAACAWGLPVAPGQWIGAVQDASALAQLLRARGRFRVHAEVPKNWAHVGLLARADESGAWEWPHQPGRAFETWCDSSELHLALQQGWPVRVIEGFTMREGKPLNTFTDRITRTIGQVEQMLTAGADQEVGRAIRSGLRAMFVGLIGGFAQRGHDVWRSAPIRAGHPLPAPEGVNVRRSFDGKTAFWVEHNEQTDLSFAHPEWAAAVWARARNRLLDSPGISKDSPRFGALHLPRQSVLAFAADALYLDHDPGWPDDGGRGRFRRKGKALDFAGYTRRRNVPQLPPRPTEWAVIDGIRAIAEGVVDQ